MLESRIVDIDFPGRNVILFHRLVNCNQRSDTENIKLNEANTLVHDLINRDDVFSILTVTDADIFIVWLATDNDTASMDTVAAWAACDAPGVVEKFRIARIFGYVRICIQTVLPGLLDKALTDFLHFGIRKAQDPASITNACDRRGKHDIHNLHNTVFTVFIRQIFYNRCAVTDIDIYIREVLTLDGKETTEVEVVFNRIKLRNADQIAHQRAACRTTPRTNNDTVFTTPRNIINKDKKVITKVLFLNNFKLLFDTLLIDALFLGIEFNTATADETLFHKVTEIACRRSVLRRNLNLGKFRFMPWHGYCFAQIRDLVSIP